MRRLVISAPMLCRPAQVSLPASRRSVFTSSMVSNRILKNSLTLDSLGTLRPSVGEQILEAVIEEAVVDPRIHRQQLSCWLA